MGSGQGPASITRCWERASGWSEAGPGARRGARAAPRLRGSSRMRAALDRLDGAGTVGYPGARDYGGDNPLLRCAALPFVSHPRPCRDLSARRDADADAAPVQATAGAGSRGDVRRIAQAAARAQFALSAPGPHPADGRANAVKEFVA